MKKKNQSTGKGACILSEDMDIYAIISINSIKHMKFEYMINTFFESNLSKFKNLMIKTEDVLDNKQEIDFVPFICIEKCGNHLKMIHFNMFDPEGNKVIQSLSCNPGPIDILDILVSGADIQLCRINEVHTTRERNKFDKNFREAEIMSETQNTHYAITYYFEHQFGRFLIKEFAVVYRY